MRQRKGEKEEKEEEELGSLKSQVKAQKISFSYIFIFCYVGKSVKS